MVNKRAIGSEMEKVAVRFLLGKGFRIIERNYYIRGGEADIIATDGSTLCFIEVKYRATDEFGTAEEAVTPVKQRRLIKLARVFIMKNPMYADFDVRFDVIAINGNEINLIKGAFDAV